MSILVINNFTGVLSAFAPRACDCDCDFCRKHTASYVSDSRGRLRIQYKESEQLGRYRQGSGLIDCLICRKCGVVIGAIYQDGEHMFATLNSKALDGELPFGNESQVSLKTLTNEQKVECWKSIWFQDVCIDAATVS